MLADRFAGDPVIRVRQLSLPADRPGGEHNALVMLNVLEHIEDTVADVRSAVSQHPVTPQGLA
ncbi:MAG: hypothetical protein ACRDT2_23050 [Natronosporangium sp.]